MTVIDDELLCNHFLSGPWQASKPDYLWLDHDVASMAALSGVGPLRPTDISTLVRL
jgi:hypothetical protein